MYFYPEEDLPKANVHRRGKDYIKHFFPQWSDEEADSDECKILTPIVASPIRYSLGSVPAATRRAVAKATTPAAPVVSSSTAASRGRGRGKKRGVAKSNLPDAKHPKALANKAKPKATRPTFKG